MTVFPNNLFIDLNTEPPKEQAEDFFGTLTYILRAVTSARDSRAILLRYKEGKTFDEIGASMGISKQRASALVQDILNKITGNYIDMLKKGMKRYYEDLFTDRINEIGSVLEDSEREELQKEAFAEGYREGYKSGLVGKEAHGVNIDVLSQIKIDSLSLSVRTYNALARNGVKTIGDMLKIGDNVTTMRSFGQTCFKEFADLLSTYEVSVKNYFPKACKKWGI